MDNLATILKQTDHDLYGIDASIRRYVLAQITTSYYIARNAEMELHIKTLKQHNDWLEKYFSDNDNDDNNDNPPDIPPDGDSGNELPAFLLDGLKEKVAVRKLA